MALIGLWLGSNRTDAGVRQALETTGYALRLLAGPDDLTPDLDACLIDGALVLTWREVLCARKALDPYGFFPVLALLPPGTAEADEAAVAAVLQTADDVIRLPIGACELRARLRLALGAERSGAACQDRRLACLGGLTASLVSELDTPVHYAGENLDFLAGAFGRVLELLDRLAEAAMGPDGGVGLAAELAAAIEDGELRFALEETPEAIRESREGLDRVTAVVGALARLTLPDTGGPLPVGVAEAVSDALIASRGLWRYVAEVEEAVEPDLPEVDCDPGLLRLALVAMLANAARSVVAATGGRGELRSIVVQAARQGQSVHLAVTDDGAGHAMAGRLKASGPGASFMDGLGLSLARAFACRCGGRLEVLSGSGGTTTVLVLPVLGHACLTTGDS